MKNTMPRIPAVLLNYRTLCNTLFQAGLIFCSLLFAWLLRFDFELPHKSLLLWTAPLLILTRLAAIGFFGLLRGWWRFVGVRDAFNIAKAVLVGSLLFALTLRYGFNVSSFPRSIFFIEAILTAGFLIVIRLVTRALAEAAHHTLKTSKRVVLIGAGFAAEMIIRETARSKDEYTVVACVDDDRSKTGIKLHGIQVFGTVDQLPAVLRNHPADEALIAVPSATGAQMRRFVEICESAKIAFKTVPAMKEIIAGRISINQVRDVNLEDLLGREPVKFDLQPVQDQIQGRTVMVTGAAGSIGSELCRQILEYRPARLVCLDHNENGLFYLQLILAHAHKDSPLAWCVADVGDDECMRRLLFAHQPQIIFHAAAHKHVPMMESNVQEAITNNIFALLSLLNVAEQAGCRHFVLISSDKAVNPTNVMGATKRTCELILAARPANGMRCVAVRFGNVLGSSGSVVPVLTEQIRTNKALTITHPDVKRFFLTTREAVALVLQAFAIGAHGDILVLDMGTPIRILDLARSLIRLCGKTEDSVPIQYTGLRDGEKLEEELFYSTEHVFSTSCEKIKRTRGATKSWPELWRQLEELKIGLPVNGTGLIREKMRQIVPEFSYPVDIPDPSEELIPVAHGKAAG